MIQTLNDGGVMYADFIVCNGSKYVICKYKQFIFIQYKSVKLKSIIYMWYIIPSEGHKSATYCRVTVTLLNHSSN